MGLLSKALKAASKTKPAPKPKKRPDEEVNTFISGQAPPPATGEPFSIALQTGKQIALSVSVYADDLATPPDLKAIGVGDQLPRL